MAALVLIVDDSRAIRLLLELVLRDAGYEVALARDGLEALERLRAGGVALVLCDLHMPRLDGMGFLRELRREPALAATPVVMLTTECLESGKREGRELGVRAWIVKPFAPQQVVDAVARFAAAAYR